MRSRTELNRLPAACAVPHQPRLDQLIRLFMADGCALCDEGSEVARIVVHDDGAKAATVPDSLRAIPTTRLPAALTLDAVLRNRRAQYLVRSSQPLPVTNFGQCAEGLIQRAAQDGPLDSKQPRSFCTLRRGTVREIAVAR
jgi:hypothetical protein